MTTKSLLKERRFITENSFMDLVIWQVPVALAGSNHNYKYRLAYVVEGVCVLRYDNEAGKGDHKHIGDIEVPVKFSGLKQLVDDFMNDTNQWRLDNEHSNP